MHRSQSASRAPARSSRPPAHLVAAGGLQGHLEGHDLHAGAASASLRDAGQPGGREPRALPPIVGHRDMSGTLLPLGHRPGTHLLGGLGEHRRGASHAGATHHLGLHSAVCECGRLGRSWEWEMARCSPLSFWRDANFLRHRWSNRGIPTSRRLRPYKPPRGGVQYQGSSRCCRPPARPPPPGSAAPS